MENVFPTVSPLVLLFHFKEAELILHEHALKTERLMRKYQTPHFDFTLQRNGEEQTLHAPLLFIWPLWRALAHIGIAKWKSKADQRWQHKKRIASLSFGFYNVKMIKNLNFTWYFFFSCKKINNILTVRGCQLILFWNLCRILLLLPKNEKLYTHFFTSLWYKKSARKPHIAKGLEESCMANTCYPKAPLAIAYLQMVRFLWRWYRYLWY